MPCNVILAASFNTMPEQLFDTYLDAEAHAAVTGAPVIIEARAGARFEAFDGMLSGTILHLVPKRLIVQSWRSANWSEDAIDSTLTLSFWSDGDGARIELAHVNVPESDFAGVSQGWEKYYWAPWRAWLDG